MDASTLDTCMKAKSKEAEDIRAEMQCIHNEAQLLKIQLVSRGVKDSSIVPANLRSGPGQSQDPAMLFLEHRMMLEWLAEVCDMKSRRTFFVNGEFQIAGQKAVIGNAVQWPLPGGLNLTLPLELEGVIAGMLSKVQRSCLGLEDLESFAADWDIHQSELKAEGEEVVSGHFFVNRATSSTIVVSAWPRLPPLVAAAPSQPGFDAAKFFAGASRVMPHAVRVEFCGRDGRANSIDFGVGAEGAVQWHQEGSDSLVIRELGINFRVCDWPEYERFSLTGPFGCVDITDPPSGPAQRQLLRDIVSLSLEHELRVWHSKLQSVSEPKTPGRLSCTASLPSFHLGGGNDNSTISSEDSIEIQHESERLPVAASCTSLQSLV